MKMASKYERVAERIFEAVGKKHGLKIYGTPGTPDSGITNKENEDEGHASRIQ